MNLARCRTGLLLLLGVMLAVVGGNAQPTSTRMQGVG
jgi:hypothetical protein